MVERRKPKSTTSVDAVWKRIQTWLREHWSEDADLPSGASKRALAKAEADMGLKIPADLRASYLLHDGSGAFNLFPFGSWRYPYPLLPVIGIVAHWNGIQKGVQKGYFSGPDFINKPKGPIKKAWFHAQWVPIVDDQCGDYIFADLAPERGGKKGQIIEFHRDEGATEVVVESFSGLLTAVADDLEAGAFAYDKKSASLMPVSRRSSR